jgi:hypothetical protein
MKRLLIRPGAIGDFLLSLPALEHLRSDYTEVWCAGQNVPLARFADRARSIVGAGLDRVGIVPADDVLDRLAEFDEIHSWYGSSREDFRRATAGLPFRFYASLPPADTALHATEFYCRQVGATTGLPRLPVPPRARQEFAVIHPFASNHAKRWPFARFRELALHLPEVHWCAGPEEPLENAVRIEDLYELGIWLSAAGVYIGNDSGITHLAAAVGTPVIALFGPTSPAVWAPRGPRVRAVSAMPMEKITAADVLDSLRSLV